MADGYLQFDAVTKVFPSVRALDGVSFDIEEGAVHALLGENGAGKSTLLKILSGAYLPTSGCVRFGGSDYVFRSTGEAIAAGVAVIYQELQLVPEMSVAENLFLGHLPNNGGWVNRRTLLDSARKQLAVLGEDVDPRAKLGSLPIGQRQMVEIAKALTRDAKVIAFDEPTSSLSRREVERLFAVIGDLKRQGKVILYVTHRMEEVFQVCDSATVLRDGNHIETFPSLEGVTPDTLVNRMVGRSIEDIFRYSEREHGSAALDVSGIFGPGIGEPASFSVARGEVLGFFGLVGAGRTELMKLVFGATRAVAGTVSICGEHVPVRTPRDAIAAGLMFCPEDRKKEGIVAIRSVLENVNLSARRRHSGMGLLINEQWERANAREFIKKLDIKASSAQLAMSVSGGNQQKVILARWLGENVKVILLDEPTRGIDVGAKSEIYSIIFDLAKQGIGVVVVSSDLPEVLGICDRTLVMRQGMIVASLARGEATEERVLQLALPATSASGVPV